MTRVSVEIVDGALAAGAAAGTGTSQAEGGIGAVIAFEGIVRGHEGERPIVALDYEAYEPMASAQLRQLAAEIGLKHGLFAIDVRHSRGRVAVGTCSFRLSVSAAHRAEALSAMGEFIDRMKRDVAIWKRAMWCDDTAG
jgi:molybdopterin synthase catalytic subunit